jgi:phosphoserine phosphatase RsbU/P
MYSDGLVEATNARNEEYGEARLRELLATVTENTAEEIRKAILASLSAFKGAIELQDDLTLVVAQFISADDSQHANTVLSGQHRI